MVDSGAIAIEEELVKKKLASVFDGLPQHSRKKVLEQLSTTYQAEVGALTEKLFHHQRKRDLLAKQIPELQKLLDWVDAGAVPTLGRKEHSSLHKLQEAERDGRIRGRDLTAIEIPSGNRNVLSAYQQTILVRHDWAAAFDGAEGLDGEIKLPFELCAFEFNISGWPMIALAMDIEGSEGLKFTLFSECAGEWYSMDNSANDSQLIKFVWTQVRAICIALDAEVATHEVVRAPTKLNEKRVAAGKLPMRDVHIVDLSKRHRIANPIGGHSDRKVRLHFRRGHWRHFETYKTWVRWCLVGDPALGFITKRYSI